MQKRIPFKVLPIGNREAEAVADVIRNKNLGMGKLVHQFEEEFAAYVGSKYAVAVDCCTSALYLSMRYRALDNGIRLPIPVAIPSMTVPLVPNTIIHMGAEIQFLDECDWVGHHYELKPYNIIDSAHEVSKDQFKGYKDDTLMCFSFYPTKPITSCEGGMIATNDIEAVKWLQKARYYGRNSGSSISKNSWEYDIEFPGWKMNMTEVQAAIGLEQLHKLPRLTEDREFIIARYNFALKENQSSAYLYRINVPKRDEFIKWMDERGVECGVHFKPLHEMKCYSKYRNIALPKTEEMGKTTVSLPLYDSLTTDELIYISNLVLEWRNINGK